MCAQRKASARRGASTARRGRKRTFQGTSARGDLQEAVANAVKAALSSLPGADRLVRWELVKLAGQRGGIVGVDEITATISATAV